MNRAKNVLIVILLFCVFALSRVVIRLENYRYGNSLGMCDKYKPGNPLTLIDRDECLEKTQTRTNDLWHLFYALTD